MNATTLHRVKSAALAALFLTALILAGTLDAATI